MGRVARVENALLAVWNPADISMDTGYRPCKVGKVYGAKVAAQLDNKEVDVPFSEFWPDRRQFRGRRDLVLLSVGTSECVK